MIKLKIRLFYKFLFLTFVYVILITRFNVYKTSLNVNTKEIEGVVTSFIIDGNKLTMIVNSKDRVIVNYYIKTINEKQLLLKKFKIGDKYFFKGNLSIPSKNTNFNLFNYQKFLKSKKIYWIFKCDSYSLVKNNTNLFYEIKDMINRHILSYRSYNYLETFILGNNNYINDDIKNSYQINGISHLLAISGMHVSILSLLLLYLLKRIFNYKLSYLITITFLLFFMFLTNFLPSVMRATLVFAFLFLNKLFNLKYKPIDILLFVLMILLIYNPFYIYDLGFKFSFLISIYLMKFGNIIGNYNNYFIKTFVTSFISFLASFPIMINNFFEINLLSIILNIIFVPFVSFIIFPLSLITFFIKPLDNLFYLITSIFEKMSLFFSNINMFKLVLARPNIVILIIYVMIIFYILRKIEQKKYKYLLILLLFVIIHSNINYLNNNAYITFIDVGQGDSTLIVLPHNKSNILIDTGGKQNFYNKDWQISSNYSIAKNTIIPYLKSIGIKKLDYLVLTHGG